MDRRQKIMRPVIDTLTAYEHLEYRCNGAITVIDPNLIALEFTVRKGAIRGELGVRGMIDMPLILEAQYDNRTLLNDHPELREQISKGLAEVAQKVNRLL